MIARVPLPLDRRQHADAVSRIDIASLIEDGRLVGDAVVVGVFENQDAIPLGAFGMVAVARTGDS